MEGSSLPIPPTKISRLDCNSIFSAVVVTLIVMFVSSTNFSIVQVSLASISLTRIRKRIWPSTEPCATPHITSRLLDDLPFITTRCFISESHLRIFPVMPCDSNSLVIAYGKLFQTLFENQNKYLPLLSRYNIEYIVIKVRQICQTRAFVTIAMLNIFNQNIFY